MFYDSDKHGKIDVNDHDDLYILPINTFKDMMGSARKTDDKCGTNLVVRECGVDRVLSLT